MKYLIYKSLRDFKIFSKSEFKYFKYKILFTSMKLPIEFRYHLMLKMAKLKSKKVKFKRRCIVTGFSRSFKRISLSRMVFREFISFGCLNGLKKSSW